MLKSEYGVKYPFPHSVVHIIDNSMYRGELPVVIAEDPSLYATIVVCGAPMGEDNKMVLVNRSDVANVAFGLSNIDASTIEKYGQSITYVSSLINQNVPVKFMRVTPDDAAYGAAIIVIQWRVDPDDNKIHVRFKNAEWPASISRSRFKNTARVNEALVSALNNDALYEDGYTWTQRVLINAIPAGRGAIYNNMSFAVNMSTQSRKPANVKYIFSTIDSRNSQVVERFSGSLVNINNQDRTDYIPTVNTVINQRIKGSSIIVPYVNEKAVTELYQLYMEHLNKLITDGYGDEYARRVAVSINVNTFDVIYGNYIYNGTDNAIKLPFYQVDTINNDIVKLDSDHLVDSGLVEGVDYSTDMFREKIVDMTTSIVTPNDTVHVGDLYLTAQSSGSPKISVIAAVNQYTGAVTSITIPKLFPPKDDPDHPVDYTKESKEIAYQVPTLISELAGATTSKTFTMTELASKYPELATRINMNVVAQYDLIAGANDTTFEVYYIARLSNTSVTIQKLTNEQIYFGLDRNSHKNLIKGTGNVIAWEYDFDGADADLLPQIPNADASYTDYVLNLIGYGVIAHGTTAGDVDVYVNNYDGTTRIKVVGVALKVGTVPQSVALNNDTVGEKYDVCTYEPSAVDTFRIENIRITDSTSTDTRVRYSVDDYVSVVIDESDVPKKGYVQMATKTDTTGTDPVVTFYLVEDGVVGNVIDAFDTEMVYNECGTTDGTTLVPASKGTTYIATETEATYDSLVAVTTRKREYISGDETVTEYIVTNQHLVIQVDGVDSNGNITAYHVIRSAAIANSVDETTGDSAFGSAIKGDSYKLMKITYADPTETYITLTDENAPDNWGTADTFYVAATQELVTFTGTGTELDPYVPAYAPNTYATKEPAHTDADYATAVAEGVKVMTASASPYAIKRYIISGSLGSLYRISADPTEIPANYYNEKEYGIVLDTENGGVPITGGSTGFFDDANMNSIVYKWKYSALLVRAFKGELDKSIQSPTRTPAKYLFDGAWNTIVGSNIVPELRYTPEELINASTAFTEDEKEAILFDKSLLDGIGSEPDDIDVKAAMYELMDYRVFQGIPDDFRPLGQGSGLSLHLDSGVVDDNTLQLVANSFSKRFASYNASWDIGGYKDPVTGCTFTYTKWIVDHMFDHMARYTVNKPFANSYSAIPNNRYISYFPDIDTVDWDKRAKAYVSGGNSWIVDQNGNLVRQSQRTLYRVDDTSDLIQESNARTLSQLTYLLQNKINEYLLEYSDDEVLQTMTNDCNMMFSNWVGTRVDALNIKFERDINPEDGGDLVVCYCDVTFKGLVLRVPIIVNVQRRAES